MVALKSASVDFNFAQQVSLSLASIIPGILSCLGSGAVIWMISKDWERKIKKLYYRYLISLCIADLFYTFWLIAWPLPIPVDTPGIWGAVGNYRSCNIQGFVFVAGGLITSFYTCALSHYFYCSICYNMTDAQIAGRYERWIHLFIAIYSLGVCIFLFIGDYYAYTAIGCHIAAYPFDCRETDGLDCIRGQHASEVSTLTVGLPNAMIGLYIIYTMTSIYRKVHAVSKRAQLISFHAVQHQFSTVELHPPSSENLDAANSSDKHTPSRNSPNAKSDLVQETYSAGKDVVEDQRVENEQTSATDRQKEGSVHATPSSKMEEGHLPQPIQAGTSSIETQQTRRRASFMGQSEEARSSVDVHSQRTRESAWQAFFYISYYAISRIIAGVLMNMIGFSVQVPFFLMLLYYVVWPVQGFWNAFVFVRPRVKAYRHEHPEASYWAAFRHVFTSA